MALFIFSSKQKKDKKQFDLSRYIKIQALFKLVNMMKKNSKSDKEKTTVAVSLIVGVCKMLMISSNSTKIGEFFK